MRALWLLVLAGCGGAPFEGPTPEAQEAGAAAPDAQGAATPDAPVPDAPVAVVDAGPGDVTAPDAADAAVCLPVVWRSPADGSAQGPFAAVGCQIDEAPSAQLPEYFAVRSPAACVLMMTPLACRCAATYSCACLVAATHACVGTGFMFAACDDSTGAPIITCN